MSMFPRSMFPIIVHARQLKRSSKAISQAYLIQSLALELFSSLRSSCHTTDVSTSRMRGHYATTTQLSCILRTGV